MIENRPWYSAYEATLSNLLTEAAHRQKRSIERLSKKVRTECEHKAKEMTDERFAAEEAKPAPRETKRSVCAEVFNSMVGARRKNVIASMMDLAGLSKAGASTYYQNFFSGKWAH